MEEHNSEDKFDDVVLPGFRFHPTDEELVGFYLKRRVLQKSLPIELIKQVDIYKYDPWDLPKLATMGEKEWYFYCPRDRKYRNSTRPNRVTGAGFWKATGTDRPIYSSDGAKCIGLKKSLVFYRGRAAKGFKTDWMMHEFRLPSHHSHQHSPKKLHHQLDNDSSDLPAAVSSIDAWAICRIFKKTNSVSTQRAISQSCWDSTPIPIPQTTTTILTSDILNHFTNLPQENSFLSCTTDSTLLPSAAAAAAVFVSPMLGVPYSAAKTHNMNNRTEAAASVMNIMNNHDQNYYAMALPQEVVVPTIRPVGFPFAVPLPEAWRVSDVAAWEATQCASEMSTTSYSTNN